MRQHHWLVTSHDHINYSLLLKSALASPTRSHTRLESELSAKALHVKAKSPTVVEAQISAFAAPFINFTPFCCTTDTMTEEIKRQIEANYWTLAECRYCGGIIEIHEQK